MSTQNPLVTIGIPIYNEEKYIEAALNSAMLQSFKNIRIVVSDNCSSDSSVQIVESIAAKDPRIALVRQQSNIGPIANFKILLEQAQTKYFMWLGAHDLLAETFVENAIQKLESNPTIVEVYPLMGQIIGNEKVDDYSQDNFYTESSGISERMLQIINNANTGSATHGLFRTSVLKKVYLDIDLNGGDLYFFLKAATFGLLVPGDSIGYYLKEARPNETIEEQELRYAKFGFRSNWREIHSMYPFEVISGISTLTFQEKLELLSKARIAMYRFRGNSWGQIIRYHLKKFEPRTSFLALMCRMKGK